MITAKWDKSFVMLNLCCQTRKDGMGTLQTDKTGREKTIFWKKKEKIKSQSMLINVGGLYCQVLMISEMWDQL